MTSNPRPIGSPQPGTSKSVCVLGVHRSGTSLITRGLNLLGVYLGRGEHLMQPHESNPEGFWENERIVGLNNEILWRLGGTWNYPPSFPRGWHCASEFGDLRERARGSLAEEFGDFELWGWKDPRTCLTLPFWQQLVFPMQYVICLRHPADVVRSIHRRNGLSFEHCTYLWLTYMKSALEHTTDAHRLFVSYEHFLDSPQEELRHLAEFLPSPNRGTEPAVGEAVHAAVHTDLQHHGDSENRNLNSFLTTPEGEALHHAENAYALLAQIGSGPVAGVTGMLNAGLELVGPDC